MSAGKDSGAAGDVRKRNAPLLDYYERSNRLHRSTAREVEQIYADVQRFWVKLMIIGKSRKEIDKMRAAGQLVGSVLQELRRWRCPAVTTLEINDAADKMIRDGGAYPTSRVTTVFHIRSALRSTSRSCTAFRRSMN
jgi:Xaa-Pro aminopeptidase